MVVRFLQSVTNGPRVGIPMLLGGRFGIIPESRQMGRKVVTEERVDMLENPGRAGPRIDPGRASSSKQAGLIGKDGLDGLAKVATECIGVALIHQANETLHRLRIQEVTGQRTVLPHLLVVITPARIVFDKMHPADG